MGWVLDPAIFPWAALVLGLAVGSFLNVVIYRLPKMMEREWRMECAELAGSPAPAGEAISLLTPRSRCPSCATLIPGWHNIPLVSWIVLRAKCANCGAKISARYPLVELLAGMGAALCAWRFGAGAAAIGATLFIWFTIALAFIDHETGLLPDDLTLPLVWVGLLVNTQNAFVPLHDAVLGAAAGYLALWLIYWAFKLATGKEGMGYGDFKMNAAVGALLGWKMLPLVILLSSVVGLVFGSLQMFAARGKFDASFRFHFGPYLAMAGVVALFWGPQMMRWWLARI